MIRKVAALLLAPVVLAVVAFWGSAASAADAHASSFVTKANAERASRGLPRYTVASDLTAVARRHAERMAAKKTLYHNPNLGSEVSGWQVVGENVGMGGDVDSIHKAFMDSPGHRANILSTEYTQVGIGTVVDADGVMWVTQVFRLPMRATVSVPAPAKPRVVVASRSRTTVSRPAPARPAAKPVARKAVAAPAPVAVDANAIVGALADATAVDPMAQAMAYADAMGALGR